METVISTKRYTDFKLSNKNIDIFDCSGYNFQSNLITHFDFTNQSDVNLICAEEAYIDSLPINTPFCISKISGNTFNYHTELNNDGIKLCGGFYQGIYKDETANINLLPILNSGWTVIMDIKPQICESNDNLPQLNEISVENAGIFYYLGLRSENMLCSNELDINKQLEIIENHLPENENSFLWFQEHGSIKKYLDFININCCENLKNNGIAFFINSGNTINNDCFTTISDVGDYHIGFKYITSSATTICVSGLTHNELVIVEHISSTKPLFLDTLSKIMITFTPIESNCVAKFGNISIYVDGFLVLSKDNIPNIVPYGYDTELAKIVNSGVTYNMAIGGGTVGLLENPFFFEEKQDKTYYNYEFIINEDKLTGFTIDDVTITFSGTTDIQTILDLLKINLPNTLKDITYIVKNSCTKFKITLTEHIISELFFETYITIVDSETCCTTSELSNISINITPTDSFIVPANENCGLIEQHFTGTFIGTIKDFYLYDKSFNYNQLKCL